MANGERGLASPRTKWPPMLHSRTGGAASGGRAEATLMASRQSGGGAGDGRGGGATAGAACG
eukprot:3198084-Prymnesium_polylepis.1